MLNPSFSKAMQKSIVTPYLAPPAITNRTIEGNEAFSTGKEYRLQAVYGEEIWLKLERAGLAPDMFNNADVLEVCAGTGFLTFHLLQRCHPKQLIVNDISANELRVARQSIEAFYPVAAVDWVLGDIHTYDFGRRFDVIIGNSFIHHFYDVPKVLARIAVMLNRGGVFISLHEPTPMSIVVQGAKIAAWPLGVMAPGFVTAIARARHKGKPSSTDLWMFEADKIKQVALQAGFTKAITLPYGLLRPIVVQRHNMHLSERKPALSEGEEGRLRRAIRLDARLNRYLPQRCFGSLCLVCKT